MDESAPSEPRQRIMTSLHRQYSLALQYLRQEKRLEGIIELQNILKHQFMSDSDMQNLKYSCLMSLANLYLHQQESLIALGKYWDALQIVSNKSTQLLQKGSLNHKQFNQSRSDSQFVLLLKMLSITEKEQLGQFSIYLLKRAISISPLIWRQKLIIKLKDIYTIYNKTEALNDLSHLMGNKKKIDQILISNIKGQTIKNKSDSLIGYQAYRTDQYLKQVTIKINIFTKEQTKIKYSCWENFLTITYILLKCQLPRAFNKKKFKKLQQSKQWLRFVKEFDPLRTKIYVQFSHEDESSLERIQEQQNINEKYSKLLNELSLQILKAQYAKKKIKKTVNPLQELTRLPSSTKDPKKQTITQAKSLYSSVNEYYKQTFNKNGFNKQLLNFIKPLDQGRFQEVLGKIFVPEISQEKKDEDNDDQQEQKSGNNNDRQTTKQKKTLKNKKQQLAHQISQLNKELVRIVQQISAVNHSFINIYDLLEKVTIKLIKEKVRNESTIEHQILMYGQIRKILQKNILKLMQKTNGYFSNYFITSSNYLYSSQAYQFVELLLEKIDQLIDKDSKNKQFKDYQEEKKMKIIIFIKDNFSLSLFKIKQLLQNENLDGDKLRLLISLSQQFIRLNYFYGYHRAFQVSHYRNLFLALTQKLVRSQRAKGIESKQKNIVDIIDKQIQKYQKKINTKTSLLAITEQKEQSELNSIDQIFKKDSQLSSALPMMKIFNCFVNNDSQKNSKVGDITQQISSQTYLESFIKLSEIFSKKLQIQSTKQFNSRLLYLVSDLMKIKQVVGDIYERFINNSAFQANQVNQKIFIQTLFHLIRLYLLNSYEQNDHCIRIMFFITNIILRLLDDNTRLNLTPKCIYLFDELIKFKKFKPQILNVVRKKFYQNIIVKNISFIYQSPIFNVSQIEETKVKKKKQRKNSQKSESQPLSVSLQEEQNVQNESEEIKQKIFDILYQIYFNPDKDKQFNPKKIEEAVGCFMYMLKCNYEDFHCEVVQLENDACKMLKKCYKIYSQKRSQVFQYCDKFRSFKLLFQAVMNGDQNPILKEKLLKVIQNEQKICQCCTLIKQKYPFYVESLFIIGKYFESLTFKDDQFLDKQQKAIDHDKDEVYYFEYLSLNLDSQTAWENIIRINANKSYLFFDSINQINQLYKGKFLYTKRIISTISDSLPSFKKAILYGSLKLQILNMLKIKEREYFAMLKQIESKQAENKQCKQVRQYKDQSKKYKEGLRKIWHSQIKSNPQDIRIRFMRLMQIKIKMFWINIQKQLKQEKRQIIIDLQGDDCDDLSMYHPSKSLLQTKQIVNQIKDVISALQQQEKSLHVQHLEDDLVVKAHIFYYQNIDFRLNLFMTSINNLINSKNNSQKNQIIKETEFCLSELRNLYPIYTQFVTNSEKYQIKHENLEISAAQIDSCHWLIQQIFTLESEREANKFISYYKDLSPKKKKKSIIQIINLDEKPIQQKIQIQQRQIPRKNSISASSNSSKLAKNKKIIIDVPKYFSEWIKNIVKEEYQFKNLQKIRQILVSGPFIELILKIGKAFAETIRILSQTSKLQTKRFKNRRCVGIACLSCSQMILKYGQQPEKAYDIIKQFYNPKNDELIMINLMSDRVGTQKNEFLAQYYNRFLYHQIIKIKFIQHVIKIFEVLRNKEALVILNRKLLKLSKVNQRQQLKIEKQKQKNVKSMEIQEQNKEVDLQQEKPASQVPKESIIKLIKDNKEKQQQQSEIKSYFLLFCEGVSTFVRILKKESQQGIVQQKYEKNILQFKKRIKKSSEKGEYIHFYKNIEDFLNYYEEKYTKKIKMKKSKKQKQPQNIPLFLPTVPQIIQTVQKQDLPQPQMDIQPENQCIEVGAEQHLRTIQQLQIQIVKKKSQTKKKRLKDNEQAEVKDNQQVKKKGKKIHKEIKKKEDKPAKLKIKDAVESIIPKPKLPRKPPTERVFKADQKSQQ